MSNVGSVTNFFSTANEGFTTTLSGSILAGATTVPLTTAAGLTNGSVFVGIIEPGLTKQQVFTGTVDTSGSQITSVVWTRGTNADHTAGVSIVDYVTGTDHNMMSTGILKQHTQAGAHKSITTDSLTASGAVAAATASTSGAATLNSVVTNTIGASGASHVAISAGTSKLVKTTVLRQDDTSNTYQVGNSVMLTGWGVIVPGAAANFSEAITFGVTFTQRPVVTVSSGGDNTSGTLTYGAGTAARKNFFTEAHTVTTTGFTVRGVVSDATNWTAGDSAFYQWTAIGEI